MVIFYTVKTTLTASIAMRGLRFFRQISTTSYGNCYVFNGNISDTGDQIAGRRNTTLTGADYGLTLVLYTNTNDYMPSTVSQTVGARVTIHSSDTLPLVNEAGMNIAPASVSSISLKESGIIRQEYPYHSNCYRRWSQVEVEPVVVDENTGAVAPTGQRYSLPECQRICLQLNIVRACGCHHILYPLDFAVHGKRQVIGEACDLSHNSLDSNCTDSVARSMSMDASSVECGCSAACEEWNHQPQLSVAKWPQGNFLTTLLKKTAFVPHSDLLDSEALVRWSGEFLKLNVYYRDISSDIVQETPTYTVRAIESPTYTVRAIESPTYTVRAIESPTYTVRAIESPTYTVRAIESPTYTVRAIESPTYTIVPENSPPTCSQCYPRVCAFSTS
ncbi:degenerin-like protein unc-105 [Pollicipes pollicipes]|uniref:degenerin-like protein unc-105 n=1 Tax=Pollicipes pollicipes TaxID=41117 RepID=UPI001884F851|nr:degenerin-like protein unc-105 [Pollicipes pollicipes]